MRQYRAAATALLLSLALAACVPAVRPPSPAETAAAQQAAALAGQGQFDQAAQAYLALAGEAPGRADHYRLLAAEAYRQENALDRAAPLVAAIDRSHLEGDEPLRLDLLRAGIALSQHDAATALQITTRTGVHVPQALLPRLLELRAQAQAASHDYWGAGHTRVQMDGLLQGLDRTQNRQQAIDLLAKVGVDELKQRAAAMRPGDRMLPWINEALTKLGVTVAQSQPNLGQPVGTLLPGAGASVREGYKVPASIALLLPEGDGLTGVSQAIREGFFAAYFDAASTHAPRPTVRVYDSGGSADGALKAYQQAVADGARMVVGPLTRAEVGAVLGQTTLAVPVLALNHPDNDNVPAAGASEFALRPETEGAQAADHMVERGITRAYVIVSDDDFARRAGAAFKAELEARGGHVAGNAQITAGNVNYRDAIAGLGMPTATDTGAAPPAPASAASSSPAAAPAGGDTGIFISMHPEQARLLLPQLRVARIDLPVFATSHVYAGSDDPGRDNDLDGVEFCDAPWLFDAQAGLPRHGDLADLLPAARGGAARLFAFGMDAWNLVPYIDWMRAHPGSYLPGASGQLAADTFGRVRRVLVWAKFQDGVARPLGGDLQMQMANPPAPAGNAPAPADNAPVPAPAGSVPLPAAPANAPATGG
ncbi:penicillin-binding protein activator [Fulvimonas sp. R45]|uniref:penicillin-binding protein activator n=1 Tax=Fulvimonas sp. R45 TaxID=3045937 RepID=UPI00265E1757|nr:penicillin-binding protein activator [Fulvimonas sp. R45]MDO1529518.1 penicillin-binding protein activator [Fulvimonas sp. R45]